MKLIFQKIILIVFVYIILYFIYFAFTFPMPDGDSLNYHIPIAKSFLDGSFINPENIDAVPFLKYSPGSSEGILAIFLFFGIPIQLFNVLGVLFLFFASYVLGKAFKLNKNSSIIFAIAVSTLPVMLRWINMQIIDIWLAGFFTMTLALLESPKKSLKYFLVLGVFSGMLIGSKYSGPLFAGVLFVFYFRRIISYLVLKHFIIFFVPFLILGLFWYLRNFYFTGNPFFPQAFLYFKGADFKILETSVLEASFSSIDGIKNFVDALFSEYSIWVFSILASLFVIYKRVKEKKLTKSLFVALIGIANFIIYLFLPSDEYFHIFVSVIRYSLPAIIPIILSVFLFAKEERREEIVYLITFIALLATPIYKYHPKVLLAVAPIAFIIYFPHFLKARNNS